MLWLKNKTQLDVRFYVLRKCYSVVDRDILITLVLILYYDVALGLVVLIG